MLGRYYAAAEHRLLSERRDAGDLWTNYLWFGGELIGMTRGATVYYLHNDHLGRPELATNASRVAVWRGNNDTFGNREVTLDSLGGLNVGFPGQYADAESGLWNNFSRYYDSSHGRYWQVYPIGLAGGINPYMFFGGNPVMLTDPEGLAFGINMGECYGEEAAQYWADKAVQTGNPLYHVPGAIASLWTRATSNKTAIVLVAAYLARNAGSTWSLRDGSQGYTPIDAGNLMRVEKHMTGSARAGDRTMAWHSHLGGSGHLPAVVGICATGGAAALAAAAWAGEIGENDFKCGCEK